MSPIPLGIFAASGAAPAGSFDLLETTVLSSTTGTITFSGLGSYSDYKHLQVRMTARTNQTGTTVILCRTTLNGNTSNSYRGHYLRGNGSAVNSEDASGGGALPFFQTSIIPRAGMTASSFSGSVIDILDLSNTNKNTTFRSLTGIAANNNWIGLASGVWMNTSAVTSITFALDSDSFITGSRFSLYGIK